MIFVNPGIRDLANPDPENPGISGYRDFSGSRDIRDFPGFRDIGIYFYYYNFLLLFKFNDIYDNTGYNASQMWSWSENGTTYELVCKYKVRKLNLWKNNVFCYLKFL